MQKSNSTKMSIHKYLWLFQDCSDQSGSHGQSRHSLSQNYTEKMFFACIP